MGDIKGQQGYKNEVKDSSAGWGGRDGMVILIGGSSHTGKTYWAHQLVKRYHFSCLSLDHLKMGLIRSGYTNLTPEDDGGMTDFLWPVAREMVKTAVENQQDLIVEGCYFPWDWRKDFQASYVKSIRMVWLVMTERYIRSHFRDIKGYANVIERRLDDGGCCMEGLILDNLACLEACRRLGERFVLIDRHYPGEDEILQCLESQEECL